VSLVGNKAPGWSGVAYFKDKLQPLSSSDYVGKWHVFYWYPMDFTGACLTEILGFQALLKDFANDAVEVIGVSTDSFYSHQTWFQDRRIFPQEITHPVLADTNHSVTRAFDVLKANAGIAYRASAVIDDNGIVRAYRVNDMEIDCDPAEVLRTVRALRSGSVSASDWHKIDGTVR